MNAAIRPSVVADAAHSLPAWIYNDPEFFELEKQHVFRRSWQLLCHVNDIPERGDYHTFDFLGESLVAVRGDDGQVRVTGDAVAGVDQLAVHPPGQRSLAQARADAGGHFIHGYRAVEIFLTAIRQRDYRHKKAVVKRAGIIPKQPAGARRLHILYTLPVAPRR